jgi:hypothetical protein
MHSYSLSSPPSNAHLHSLHHRYPDEFVETDPYEEILKPEINDWTREVGINAGQLQPGKGPDFPGIPGPTDESGIVTHTQVCVCVCVCVW